MGMGRRMLVHADAVRFTRVSDSGRNRPLLVTVELEDGEERDVYLKPAGRPELGIDGLVAEYLASCLGERLGLPVARGMLVRLDPAFIVSVPDPAASSVLENGASIAYGSEQVGFGWRDWGPGDRLTPQARPIGLACLFFDILIDNPDRTGAPPNLLARGGELRLIDHELAFRFDNKWAAPYQPWRLGACDHMTEGDGAHVLARELKGAALADFDPIIARWSKLTVEDIMNIEAGLPAEWATGRPVMDEAVAYLRLVLERLAPCAAEIQRALS